MPYRIPGCERPLPAQSPRELVHFLMGNTRTHYSRSVNTFMRHFAMTFQDFTGGQRLSSSCPDQFVADLVEKGWLAVA
ncbi:hypothetical protein [Spirosoma fluminis]